jgi:hypothetical protein
MDTLADLGWRIYPALALVLIGAPMVFFGLRRATSPGSARRSLTETSP